MTVNFQQVNNPFTLGQVSGTANLGVSVGDIEELYELLGYTESQDLASQLVSAAGFSMIGAAPEVIKSIKYKDDVRAAYKIATSISDNKFEQFNLSNRFEDLFIGETKACNKINGNTILDKIKSWFSPSSSGKKETTKTPQKGLLHKKLGIADGNVDIEGFKTATKGEKLKAEQIENNMKTITQKLAKTAGVETEDLDKYTSLNDLKGIDNKTIKNTAKDLDKAASSSVSNIKSVTKSVAKEAFSGPCIAITAITGLATELPEIMNAFQTSSSEGWSQLGKSALTIAISDVGMSAAGQILGGTIGFALGGLLGPVGASIGGAIGKAVGSSLGSVIGRKLSSWIFGKSTSEKQQEEQLKEQAQTAASSQTNLETLLAQAKEQATQETDSKKAQKILAQVQVIENKLAKNTSTTTQSSYTNPFVLAS